VVVVATHLSVLCRNEEEHQARQNPAEPDPSLSRQHTTDHGVLAGLDNVPFHTSTTGNAGEVVLSNKTETGITRDDSSVCPSLTGGSASLEARQRSGSAVLKLQTASRKPSHYVPVINIQHSRASATSTDQAVDAVLSSQVINAAPIIAFHFLSLFTTFIIRTGLMLKQ
jgi:hypothetical protein